MKCVIIPLLPLHALKCYMEHEDPFGLFISASAGSSSTPAGVELGPFCPDEMLTSGSSRASAKSLSPASSCWIALLGGMGLPGVSALKNGSSRA